MTNTVCVLMYLPMLLMMVILLCANLVRKEKLYVDKLYSVLCALLVGWLIMELLHYILTSPQGIEFVYSAKFVFAAFVPPVFLFLAAGFCQLAHKIPRWAKAAILVVPVLVALASLTTLWHELFRVNFEVIQTYPLTVISRQWGPLYILNLVYSQGCVIGIAAIFIAKNNSLPKAYRPSFHLLMAGWSVYLVGIIIEVLGLDGGSPLDFNLIGICLASFIFFIAVSSNGRADFLNIWRRDVFDYLDEAILILDKNGRVMEANLPAERLFAELGFPAVEGENLAGLVELGQKQGLLSLRPVLDEHKNKLGEDLYILKGQYPLIYSLERRVLYTMGKTLGGEFIAFSEVTWNRLLIERLRDTAGVDGLTGLKNRFDYETSLKRWDVADNLPISVIISDVNNLKHVNDTLGHDMGDELLRCFAGILTAHCPSGAYIARIGGDEFAILLRHCTGAQAAALVEKLQLQVKWEKSCPTPLSVAFGSATKTNPEQNINQLIRAADARMYMDKRAGEGTP